MGLVVEDAEPEDVRRGGLAVDLPLEGSHTQAGGSSITGILPRPAN